MKKKNKKMKIKDTKTKEEFNLSKKRNNLDMGEKCWIYLEEDVKEFIRRLKEWVWKMDSEEGYFCGEEGERMRNQIDKLAGKHLK